MTIILSVYIEFFVGCIKKWQFCSLFNVYSYYNKPLWSHFDVSAWMKNG